MLEPKWDGFRVLAAIDPAPATRAWTRHGTEITAAIRPGCWMSWPRWCRRAACLDGELVALATGADGRVGQDFGRLAPAVFAGRPHPLSLVVFDAPRWAGEVAHGLAVA